MVAAFVIFWAQLFFNAFGDWFWLAAVLVAVASGVFLRRPTRRPRRRPQRGAQGAPGEIPTGKCRHCGYDLRGTRGRCPECGKLVPPGTPLIRD